jgi:hypothetical protein
VENSKSTGMRTVALHDDSFTHKLLDAALHVWPFLAAIGAMILTGIKLWWSDRQQIKRETSDLRRVVLWLKENSVTHKELHDCRDDVRAADDQNLEKIYKEIKINQQVNAQQHQDIMSEIIRIHGGKH